MPWCARRLCSPLSSVPCLSSSDKCSCCEMLQKNDPPPLLPPPAYFFSSTYMYLFLAFVGLFVVSCNRPFPPRTRCLHAVFAEPASRHQRRYPRRSRTETGPRTGARNGACNDSTPRNEVDAVRCRAGADAGVCRVAQGLHRVVEW